MQLLHSLHFIDIKAGKSGPISQVLIWNPHKIIRWHKGAKTPGLVEANYNGLIERAAEIGANDFLDDKQIEFEAIELPAPEEGNKS